MASSREIITVQVGTASNFVGAHWWNIQESSFIFDRKEAEADDTRLNHDVLFREGKNIQNKTTYTPRLVAVDCTERVGRTNLSRNLYPEYAASFDDSKNFGFTTNVVPQSSSHKNQFLSDLEEYDKSENGAQRRDATSAVADKCYNLDDAVTTWTDCLRVAFHPKSLLTYHSLDSPLSRFADGEAICKGKVLEAFEDRLRFFAEEADCLQGFHFLCDTHDGAAGMSKEFLRYVNDEYHGKVILAFAITPSVLQFEGDSVRGHYAWNSASSLSCLGSHCSTVIPLSTAGQLWKMPASHRELPHVVYKPELAYHTSAILAAALETATTPWRHRSNCDSLSHVCDTLAFNGRKFASLAVATPLQIAETKLCDYLRAENVTVSLTPYVSGGIGADQSRKCPNILNISLRGVKNMPGSCSSSPIDPRARCSAVAKELHERYEKSSTFTSAGAIYEPVYTKSPYPHIFRHKTERGGLGGGVGQQSVNSTPVLTILESSVRVLEFMNAISSEVANLNWQKLRLDKDDYDDTVNVLHNFMDSLRGQDCFV